MFHLAPSILAADFSKLGEQIWQVRRAGADWLHLDVMDGVFVPSISFGMPLIRGIRRASDAEFDVHLMITEPVRHVREFRAAGADRITVHVEACADVAETIGAIRESGAKAGLALNPDTPVQAAEPWLSMVDLVLVMSVQPGFGGQKFLGETLEKMRVLHKRLDEVNPRCELEADGGIYLENVREVLAAGVNVIVAGTAVFRGEIEKNVAAFRKTMEEFV